jgi:hypothetical protein
LEAWVKARRDADVAACREFETEAAKIGLGPTEADYLRSVFDADDGVIFVREATGQLGAWLVKLSQGRIKSASYQAFVA